MEHKSLHEWGRDKARDRYGKSDSRDKRGAPSNSEYNENERLDPLELPPNESAGP